MNIDTSIIIAFIRAHAWIALAAVLVGLVVRLLKSDVPIVPTVAARYRPIAALALGQVAAVLQAVAGGQPWLDAVVGGFVAAVVAMAGHDTLIEAVRGGTEVPLPAISKAAEPVLKVVILFGFFSFALTGCGAGALDAAIAQANATHDLATEAALVIREQCTAAYDSARAADVPAIDRACVPATRAYLDLRAAWTVEAAALAMQPPDPVRIAAAGADVTRAAGALADAMHAFGPGSRP